MRIVTSLSVALLVSYPTLAQDRVPGEHWMRYADPAEAGFDAGKLEAARESWEALPSSAFMVVADGAVVAAWGDLERRFMCHSVRKSFLSALYGIYWDRGEVELNQTLADLGLDDEPDPLLETEKRARILDLLKARSGVFHPAAYAGRTDSRPRGSEGPGRFFAYNNWDFNTLATILRQVVGVDLFEAFDEHFGRPLGMQDWRVSDGYYHYELDKSKYPAYPFRMSARDAARFGLLFARMGRWGDERILSRHWVRRSTALYSIDSDVMGYGFMWWVFLEPRFEPHGMVSALGVGNQMIAALPDSDLVIVNRANTYADEGTPTPPLLDLIEEVLAARTGEPAPDPELVPLEEGPADPRLTAVPAAELEEMIGEWSYPPAALGLPAEATVTVEPAGDHLRHTVPGWGTFDLHLQDDGTVFEADSQETYYPIRYASGDADGAFSGLTDAGGLVRGALAAAADGELARSDELLGRLPEAEGPRVELARALIACLEGDVEGAADAARAVIPTRTAATVESVVEGHGRALLESGRVAAAQAVFELNTVLFPESSTAWNDLAEAYLAAGNAEDALVFCEIALELDAENPTARDQLARIREASATSE